MILILILMMMMMMMMMIYSGDTRDMMYFNFVSWDNHFLLLVSLSCLMSFSLRTQILLKKKQEIFNHLYDWWQI